MARIKVSSAKGKGRDLQQYVGKAISRITGYAFGKDEPISSRGMGQSGVDVCLIGPVRELFPYSIECKRQESWSIHQFIEQAQANILPGTTWMLVCKRNHKKPVVIMDFDKFMDMYEEFLKLKSHRRAPIKRKPCPTSDS